MKNFNKKVRIKREDSYSSLSDLSNAQYIPRTSIDVNSSIEKFTSNAINYNSQSNAVYTGAEDLNISIGSELKTKEFSDLISGLLGKSFAYGFYPFSTSCSLVIEDDFNYRITRFYGSFIRSGIKINEVLYLDGANLPPENKNINLVVTYVSDFYILVEPLADANIQPQTDLMTTFTSRGVTLNTINSGSQASFTVEVLQEDQTTISSVYDGCTVESLQIDINQGFPSVGFSLQGRGLKQRTNAPYFSSYVQQGGVNVLGCHGVVYIDNRKEAIRDASITISRAGTKLNNIKDVQASNILQEQIQVQVNVNGYALDDYLFNKYNNAQKVSVTFVLSDSPDVRNLLWNDAYVWEDAAIWRDSPIQDGDPLQNFFRVTLPNCSISTFKEDDSSKIVYSASMNALYLDKHGSVIIQETRPEVSLIWDDTYMWDDLFVWND